MQVIKLATFKATRPDAARAVASLTMSKTNSVTYPLPGSIPLAKSAPDTVPPVGRAECADSYPALAYLSDSRRVIACRDGLQWIIQRRRSVCPNSWRGISFCRTKEALLRCAGSGDLAAMRILRALPDWFAEAPAASAIAAAESFGGDVVERSVRKAA
jgi:hypothetical protein